MGVELKTNFFLLNWSEKNVQIIVMSVTCQVFQCQRNSVGRMFSFFKQFSSLHCSLKNAIRDQLHDEVVKLLWYWHFYPGNWRSIKKIKKKTASETSFVTTVIYKTHAQLREIEIWFRLRIVRCIFEDEVVVDSRISKRLLNLSCEKKTMFFLLVAETLLFGRGQNG